LDSGLEEADWIMAKKSIGYVKLIWTCPRCATRNPGPNKFCNGCGAPQPEDVQFEQPAEAELIKDSAELARAKAGPDIHCPYCSGRNPAGVKFCGACGGDLTQGKARQTGRVVGAYRAPSGATRPCPACGTPNPLTSLKCSNCGSALPAAETPSPAATARAPSAKTPLLIGGVAALCLVAMAVLGFLLFQRDERSGIVESVAWERTIEIERFGPVEHQDWEDEVPADASALSCEIEYRMTQDDPAPVATEVCGTPYTVDEGSGFGEVVQDCTYRVYEQMCTYTVDEWAISDTRRATGADLNPQWPAANLAANDERRGAEHESYMVTLRSDGEALSYAPSTAAEFAAFVLGSQWTVTVNGLGAIVGIAPAP
jgi:predicted nucleic acid-binding Zn ribbon protein